jgi:hypothetical protein
MPILYSLSFPPASTFRYVARQNRRRSKMHLTTFPWFFAVELETIRLKPFAVEGCIFGLKTASTKTISGC